MDKYITRQTRASRRRLEGDEGDHARIQPTPPFSWKVEPKRKTLWYLTPDEEINSEKIAAFDMDGTLISTKSGRVFPRDIYDWKFFHATVPRRLRELYEEGYKVVIITNQAGVSSGQTSLEGIQQKIQDIISNFAFIPYVLMATAKDAFRKPSSGMWRYLTQSCNGGIKAGRTKQGRFKGDKGCSDRKFAANAGISFYTPEEFFLKETPREWSWMGIDPSSIPRATQGKKEKHTQNGQEMVIFVGPPASGKSSFYRMHFQPNGYVHVNMDTLRTKNKCLSVARGAIQEGKSVAIDNTNPDPAARALFISMAQQFNLPVRCFWFQTSLEVAQHLNMVREKIGEKDHVPNVAYATFNKRFRPPQPEEGFEEVRNIYFEAKFPSAKFEKVFLEYT